MFPRDPVAYSSCRFPSTYAAAWRLFLLPERTADNHAFCRVTAKVFYSLIVIRIRCVSTTSESLLEIVINGCETDPTNPLPEKPNS